MLASGHPPIEATQVKQKSGSLRLYVDGGCDWCHGAICFASIVSRHVCEQTGRPGMLMVQTPPHRWVRTLAEDVGRAMESVPVKTETDHLIKDGPLTRGGHSAPRGSLLFATGTSLNRRPRGVTIGRRSRVKLQRRLALAALETLRAAPSEAVERSTAVARGVPRREANHVPQHHSQFGAVWALGQAQNDRDGLAGDALWMWDRLEAAAVGIGNGTSGQSCRRGPRSSAWLMSSTMRRGISLKVSQNNSTIAATIRSSATAPGGFSSRLMVGCEQRPAPLLGNRPRSSARGSRAARERACPRKIKINRGCFPSTRVLY
jgi:hypothetical protein